MDKTQKLELQTLRNILHSATDSENDLCQISVFLLFLGFCTHLAESDIARLKISMSSSQDFWMEDVIKVESISETG